LTVAHSVGIVSALPFAVTASQGQQSNTNFMPELFGNLLVAQSGGPTSVFNSSLSGVLQEAGRHECIEEIYGGANGILGILNEDLIDINEEKARTIEGIRHTPGAALGTCRYKIDFKKNSERAAKDMDRLFEVLLAHNIRYFFYIGGNDSQDTSHKIHEEAVRRGYDLRVIGVPKTIDNDLPHTDNCPGYGSVIKYNATSVMEIGLDVGSMATDDGCCCIIEVMGRAAGWIAAGAVLAKRGNPASPPHLILLPEVRYSIDAILSKIRETIAAHRYCIVVVGEGIRDENGQEIGADKTQIDAFGHPLLAGAAGELKQIVQGRLKIKTRTVMLSYAQRAASHFASLTDSTNAFACGQAAVRAAVHGHSGQMVKIVRESDGGAIRWNTGLQPLSDIANVEHMIPRDWISEDGFLPNQSFVAYALPLIQGEVACPCENGLPRYFTLDANRVEKKLPPRQVV